MSYKPLLSFDKKEHSEITIGTAIKSISSGVSVNSEDTPITSSNELGVLKTSSVANGIFFPTKNKKVIAADYERVKKPVKAKTIIVSRMNTPLLVGEVGYVNQSINNLFLPDRLWAIKTNSKYDPRWLTNYLITPKIKFRLKELATGTSGSMKNISQPSFSSISIFAPSHDEQQKIADVITSVDTKISQLTDKHRLLKEYKKGVMQQIFSQQIRFKDKDGKAFPEWRESTIGDIMTESRIKGNGGDKAQKLTVKVWGKGVIAKKGDGTGSENTQYYKRKAGQLIYGKLDFLNCAFAIIPEELDGYESTLDLPSLDVCSSVNKFFVLETVKQKWFYKRHGEIADGSRKAKRINVGVFQAMPIALPHKDEQDKIMAFWDSIDKKIEGVAEQIEQTKQFKKGLLQQMFV